MPLISFIFGRVAEKQPPEVFQKEGVLKNFTKFTGKQLCQGLIFNKVTGLRPATLLKRDSRTGVFHLDFAKFLRTSILKNISERLLLVPRWRTAQKLNRRDLLLLTCLVYVNVSVASFSFIYLRFILKISALVFRKLNLQRENYMENFSRF